MARYKDADVLIDILSNYYRQTQSLYDCVPQNEHVFGMRVELNGILGDIEVIIDNAPEADVVEVKHGKWIDTDPLKWGCSICGYRVNRWNNTPYCPNCAAKMEKA